MLKAVNVEEASNNIQNCISPAVTTVKKANLKNAPDSRKHRIKLEKSFSDAKYGGARFPNLETITDETCSSKIDYAYRHIPIFKKEMDLWIFAVIYRGSKVSPTKKF